MLGEIAQHSVRHFMRESLPGSGKVGRHFREFDRETMVGLVELAERIHGLLAQR